MTTSRRIIGVGNPLRGDDAAGRRVIHRLRELGVPAGYLMEQSGEAGALLESWQGCEEVILIDAARSGATPGTVHEFEVSRSPLAVQLSGRSTHGFGVAAAIELARALDQLPLRVTVYAIEGSCFDHNAPLSREVLQAVETLAQRLALDTMSNPDEKHRHPSD